MIIITYEESMKTDRVCAKNTNSKTDISQYSSNNEA